MVASMMGMGPFTLRIAAWDECEVVKAIRARKASFVDIGRGGDVSSDASNDFFLLSDTSYMYPTHEMILFYVLGGLAKRAAH